MSFALTPRPARLVPARLRLRTRVLAPLCVAGLAIAGAAIAPRPKFASPTRSDPASEGASDWTALLWPGGELRDAALVGGIAAEVRVRELQAAENAAGGSQGAGSSSAASAAPSAAAPQSQPKAPPKHIFFIIPAFNVAYKKDIPPLTPHEKLVEMLQETYDPDGLALSAAEALLEHSPTGFCGYGHGWGGYGKCYGAALLDANTSGFLGDYVFPVWFHQDPRYFRLGTGSIPARTLYSLSRVFVTRTDAGGVTFDSSALLGTVLAGALANTYYPKSDRGVGLTASRIGVDLFGTAIFNLEAEFWQDIRKKL